MAVPPVAAAAPAADDTLAPMDDAGAAAAGASEEEAGEDTSEVLLTVCKEADGTYRLIQGDEDEAAPAGDAMGGAMGGDMGAAPDGEGMVYDSKGALLKAILDILNEGEDSEGAEGSSEDQFQAGFGAPDKAAAGGAPPVGAMPQKY